MRFWYDKEDDGKNDANIRALRCSNCEKETCLYMNNMNTNYRNIIASIVLYTVLHHVGMSWIIETHEQVKYDIYKNNQY